jgi:hypothetical protein
MTNLIDMLCFILVMADPRAPSSRGIRGWMLARAGRYAIRPDDVERWSVPHD